MPDRSSSRAPFTRCSIVGCTARAVKGTQTLLCPGHRQAVADDLTNSGVVTCAWPACDEYGLHPTRHCSRHIALIAFHGLRYPTAEQALAALNKSVGTPEPAEPKPPTEGTIYYLRSGGYYKIGWTANLEQRMKGYPPDTLLLATHPGTKKDENGIHRRFAHLLSHGREWFPLAPEIQDHIARVIATHGPPPAVDFTARRATRAVGPRLNQYVGGPNRGKLATREVRG